tara:strand:- start:26358 stop:27728 length:1371 start_codon:yes stop_codon:yes gene_type:complete
MSDVQQQYALFNARITGDKMAGNAILVQNSVVELVLYESLEKAYLTGQVVIYDDTGIMDSIEFSGTEIFSVDIASETNDGSALQGLERTASFSGGLPEGRSFTMTSIEKAIKSVNENGTSSTYLITLKETHALLSDSMKISRRIENNLNDEIVKICGLDLKKDVDLSYSSPSVQGHFKGIIPYLHPLDACEWLRDRATTNNGSPFFLYASIHDLNIRFGNLDVMLDQPAFNKGRPYLNLPANASKTENQGFLAKTFQVSSMSVTKVQNTHAQLKAGGIGSLYNNTNISTGQTTSVHFDVTTLIDKLKASDVIKSNTQQTVYDELFHINNVPVVDSNARIFHTITSHGTYGSFKSYHDEDTNEMFKKKVDNLAIRNMLYKNMFEVAVPGAGFIMSGASVGDIVSIATVADNALAAEGGRQLDSFKSGSFLIYNTRHTFKGTRHDVVMTVCKLAKDKT